MTQALLAHTSERGHSKGNLEVMIESINLYKPKRRLGVAAASIMTSLE
jgi:hypothetical protein